MTPHSPGATDATAGQGPAAPDGRAVRRWRRYLADEQAEAAVYRHLAERRSGEDQEILLALAEAEGRHAAHWEQLLAAHAPGGNHRVRGSLRTRGLVFLARHFGSVFVLALAQRAEGRSPYSSDEHATDAMAADERIHGEVVRGLATRGRRRLSGTFRAAVFGANDGLVSNLALVLGIGAASGSAQVVLLTGLAGLLAGALSMGAGEFVSIRSQRELLDASTPDPQAARALPHLDVDANELALVYRARGMPEHQAYRHATEVLTGLRPWVSTSTRDPVLGDTAGGGVAGDTVGAPSGDAPTASLSQPTEAPLDEPAPADNDDASEAVGSAWRAAISSFLFFASGAVIPVVPYLVGLAGTSAQILAAVLVGVALLLTGTVVGLLSGGPPVRRALRQLMIGYGAAGATYLLGLAFSV